MHIVLPNGHEDTLILYKIGSNCCSNLFVITLNMPSDSTQAKNASEYL